MTDREIAMQLTSCLISAGHLFAGNALNNEDLAREAAKIFNEIYRNIHQE